MKKVILLLIFILNVVNGFSVSRNKDVIENSEASDVKQLREKIFIHIDKDFYNAGEDIWFKAYLVNSNTLRSDALSKVVYVELINPSNIVIATKIIKIIEGCGNGDFKLPIDLNNGEYILRAYTNFMRNFNSNWFFTKRIIVNALKSSRTAIKDTIKENSTQKSVEGAKLVLRPDLQFFPDGGYMVNGFVNQIGFKALDSNGKGIDLSGIIVNNLGEHVLDFTTSKFGLGVLRFVPQKNNNYKATILYNGVAYSYNLPVSLPQGVVMQIIEQKDFYTVVLQSSLPNGVKNFKFIGRQRNRVVGSSEIINNMEGAKFTVPKNILEEGIIQFTLFDSHDIPLCERLVFVEKNIPDPKVVISSSKREYEKRDLVELEISLDPSYPHILYANSCISVTNISALETDKYSMDIKSYLLLNSDLRGKIEHPGYYFYSDDPERKSMLDLLMMTQGWRQFVLDDALNDTKLKFPYETGIRFEGNVKRFNNHDEPANAIVSLIYSNSKEMVLNETETDDQGQFFFDGFDFSDSTSIAVQARKLTKTDDEGSKTPNTNLYIEMNSLVSPLVSGSKIQIKASNEIFKDYYPKSTLMVGEGDSILLNQYKHILLDPVTVIAKNAERLNEKRLMYHKPTNFLDFKEIRNGSAATNVLEAMEGRIPGVFINGDNVVVRANNSLGKTKNESLPLFLLDGLPVSENTILTLPVTEVDFVDVLKGFDAAIYGSGGANGVIAVYTHKASDMLKNTKKEERKSILKFVHPGYSQPRKFYEPVYLTRKSEPNNPDLRSTIYWNPSVKLGEKGNNKVPFILPMYHQPIKFYLKVLQQTALQLNLKHFSK